MRFDALAIFGLGFALVVTTAAAQQGADVAARVNGEAIPALDIQRLVHETLKDRRAGAEERAALEKTALEQLISRRLILAHLTRDGRGAADEEVARAVQSLQVRAEHNKQAFGDWLKANTFTRESLEQEVGWRIAWRRYLEAELTDEALATYFSRHKRHFDGSQVRAAQILWRFPAQRTTASEAALVQQAQMVREQISAGTMPFAEAAKKYSAVASRDDGGDLGFVPRHGVMDEAFSRAAFTLAPGDISPPVVSPFGVHLIRCLEIRPGKKTWSDCRDELYRALAQEYFDRLAAEQRRGAKVTYADGPS